MVSCLDPFIEHRRSIFNEYSLFKGDEMYTVFRKESTGNNSFTLLDGEVLEAVYLDSVIYLKKISSLDAIDTTYYIYDIDTSDEPSLSSRELYERMKLTVSDTRGKIVKGFYGQ